MCIPFLFYISLEVQFIIVFIPLFVYAYKYLNRYKLYAIFLVITLGLSTFPVLVISLVNGLNLYPEVFSNSWEYIYKRTWFRLPAFVIGIALAIVKFEFKYVERMNCGRRPFHKKYLEKLKRHKYIQKALQGLGVFLMVLPIFLLMTDTWCIDQEVIMKNTDSKLNYCWGVVSSSIFNCFSGLVFLIGVILTLNPCLLEQKTILRNCITWHIWSVLEELTFSAFNVSFMVSGWFFASRQNDLTLSPSLIAEVGVATFFLSHIFGLAYYLIIERPFKNFLNLVLFPATNIFMKQIMPKEKKFDSSKGHYRRDQNSNEESEDDSNGCRHK